MGFLMFLFDITWILFYYRHSPLSFHKRESIISTVKCWLLLYITMIKMQIIFFCIWSDLYVCSCFFLLIYFCRMFQLCVGVLVLLFTRICLFNTFVTAWCWWIKLFNSTFLCMCTFLFSTFLSMCTFLIHTVLLLNILKGYSLSFTVKASHRYKRSVKGGSLVGCMVSPYIFAVPALLCSSPTVHHNDANLHWPSPRLYSARHSKVLIQRDGTCLVKLEYSKLWFFKLNNLIYLSNILLTKTFDKYGC